MEIDATLPSCESRFGAPFASLSERQMFAMSKEFASRGGLGSGERGFRQNLLLQAAFSDGLEGRRRAIRELTLGGRLSRAWRRLTLRRDVRRAPINPLNAAICAEAYGWQFVKTTDHWIFGPYRTPDRDGMVGVYEWRDRPPAWPQERHSLEPILMFVFRDEALATAYAEQLKAVHESRGKGLITPLIMRASNLVVDANKIFENESATRVRDSLAAWLSDCLVSFTGTDAPPVVVMEPAPRNAPANDADPA